MQMNKQERGREGIEKTMQQHMQQQEHMQAHQKETQQLWVATFERDQVWRG